MEFNAGLRRNRKNQNKLISDNLGELYPHNLQLYKVPPANEIPLSEFEDLAFERLQLLRVLEQASQKGHVVYSNDWVTAVKSDLRKQRLMKFLHLLESGRDDTTILPARRADHISHFILRLAYCRSEDLRRWFLAREQEWFRLRFRELRSEEVKTFLEINQLVYMTISNEEKRDIRTQLYDSTSRINEVDVVNFYKVPFQEVYSLVRDRKVFVQAGFAYIPDSELVTCILSTFRAHLSEALAYASHKIASVDDDRLNFLLKNLHTSYTGRNYTVPQNENVIDIQNLDHYAKKHYPLCMRYIHQNFRSSHHMKHHARLQYGMFTKGIGVLFEDAMKFWRDEFTKLIDDNTFEKKYSYAVKHYYGKVGAMKNYSPYSCLKIINENVGPGEHHGCPFKHFDATSLQQKLNEYGVSKAAVDEILALVKSLHYQVACTKYFEYVHGEPPKNFINHPNQYFEESFNLSKGGPAKKAKPLLDTTVTAEELGGEN